LDSTTIKQCSWSTHGTSAACKIQHGQVNQDFLQSLTFDQRDVRQRTQAIDDPDDHGARQHRLVREAVVESSLRNLGSPSDGLSARRAVTVAQQ